MVYRYESFSCWRMWPLLSQSLGVGYVPEDRGGRPGHPQTLTTPSCEMTQAYINDTCAYYVDMLFHQHADQAMSRDYRKRFCVPTLLPTPSTSPTREA